MTKNLEHGKRLDKSVFDGLYSKNTIFVSALVVAPVVSAACTVRLATTLAIAFSLITFTTIMIASFVPRDIVYAIRIILYTFIASMVYVPVVIIINTFFPNEIAPLGIFLPLLITNSLIVSKAELRFFRRPKSTMALDVVFYVLGFDVAVLIFSVIREVLSLGAIGDRILGLPLTFSALSMPFGGFILLGLLAALFRKIRVTIARN